MILSWSNRIFAESECQLDKALAAVARFFQQAEAILMSASRKTTFFTFLYKGALSALTLVNSALVARYLNRTDRGEYQYASTYVQTGMTYVGGFSNYYSFAIPKRSEDRETVIQMGNLLIYVLSLIVWLIGLALIAFPIPSLHVPQVVTWTLVVLPFNFIFGYGSRILQGLNEIAWLNRVNMAQPVMFLLLFLSLFLTRNHVAEPVRLTLTYTVWTLSFLFSVVFTMVLAYKMAHRPGVLQWRYSRRDWLGTIHYGGWSSIAQLVNQVNYRVDFWLVGYFVGINLASVYGIAVTASEVLLNISGSIQSVVFTRMTGGSREDAIATTETSVRHTFISSVIVALGMYVVFPWLIPLAFSAKYLESIAPFLILLPGVIFRATGNILIQYATNSLGNPKISIWMNGASAAINAAFSVLLLPTLGMMGGAIASTLSYVLSYFIYVFWFARLNQVSPSGLLTIQRTDLLPYLTVSKQILQRVFKRPR